MDPIVIEYNPGDNHRQMAFHKSTAYEILYGGAAGGGKSAALVMDGVAVCMAFPGVQVYLFRKTYPELKDSLIFQARKFVSRKLVRYNQSQHDMDFPNGSSIHFRYCRNITDAHNYQGPEMNYLGIDELTHFTKDVYDYLKTRVRTAKRLGFDARIRCTCNPGGIGHAWVKAYFVDGWEWGKIRPYKIYSPVLKKTVIRTKQFIPALPTDNPHLDDAYIIELELKPENLRKALLLGQWDVFEGQAFTEWRNDPTQYKTHRWTHVIEPFEIPDFWPRWRSLDWGYSKPFSVGWWAVSPNGRVYRYRELYGGTEKSPNVGCRWHPTQIGQKIAEIEEAHKERITLSVADPSIFEESHGNSIASLIGKAGVYFEPADNSRIPGKMQYHYRLAFDEDGIPLFQAFNTCRHFIRTFPNLALDEHNVEDIDTDQEDHPYDETRYFLMENPIGYRVNHEKPREWNPLEIPQKKPSIFEL